MSSIENDFDRHVLNVVRPNGWSDSGCMDGEIVAMQVGTTEHEEQKEMKAEIKIETS